MLLFLSIDIKSKSASQKYSCSVLAEIHSVNLHCCTLCAAVPPHASHGASSSAVPLCLDTCAGREGGLRIQGGFETLFKHILSLLNWIKCVSTEKCITF